MDERDEMRKREEAYGRVLSNELVEISKSDRSLITTEENVLPNTTAHQVLFGMEDLIPRLNDLISSAKSWGVNNYLSWAISTEYAKSLIRENEERSKALNNAKIELLVYRAKHEEDLRFELEKRRLNNAVSLAEECPNSVKKIDYIELEEYFIKFKNLIRIMKDYEIAVYYWDDKRSHYVSFKTKSSMITALSVYAYDEYGRDIEISNTKLEDAVNRMINSSVPLLGEGCEVKPSNDMQVFFQNGWYDLATNSFYPEDTRMYFHTDCLPYSFEASDQSLLFTDLEFDNFLNCIFDSDGLRVKLIYQIMGAILSDVPVKNVFVFQGVSNGGKSLLSSAIVRLRDRSDVEIVGSINEINASKSKSYEGRTKLLYIDDAPNEKWSDATVSYLKTRSSGISRVKESLFKILLCTNYSILYKTEDGRDYSMDGRIVLLPFAKDLKVASKLDNGLDFLVQYLQGERFEQEKPAIAMKALFYFREVLANNREFAIRYPLNECVVCSRLDRINDGSNPAKANVKNGIEIRIKQTISDKNLPLLNFLKENFELSDDERDYMTTEQILSHIRQLIPGTNGRENEVGKPVKAVFGEDCCLGKVNGKTCYKLRLKSQAG